MKYLLPLIAIIAFATACKKNNCVQCSRQVPLAAQNTSIYNTDSIVYVEFCGRQADTAINGDAGSYTLFISEHNVVPYTCFYH